MSQSNVQNELHVEMAGIHGLNPFFPNDSSSRSQMMSSHFSQRLVIKGCQEKRIQSGLEQEFGQYTFSVKMPENGQIIKVIHRYPRGNDANSLNFNPETIVIYENDETKEIDYFSIPHFCSYHQFFGFEYKVKDTVSKLKPGAFIPKDTIFADSPSVSDNSGFMYGTNMNVAFMSIPSVSEDGVMISRDKLGDLAFNVFETRVVEFGAGQFPLNLYGTKDLYKPFPDIGDYIREDGVLMMVRDYDSDLTPVQMSVYDTMEPDFIFDRATYVRGGRGRVVDIKVISNNNPNRQLPEAMCGHIDKYARALRKFHEEIIETERALRAERRRKYREAQLKLSPRFHRLIVESLAIVNYNPGKIKQQLGLLFRKTPIDEYRVEFVVQYEMTPTIGFKLTDCHGGKGVICKVEEPENMPVDEAGNRADIVMDSASVISRMNLGRLYEHYFGAACRDVTKSICTILGVNPKAGKITEFTLSKMDPDVVQHAYQRLMHFYQLVSDRQYQFFNFTITEEEKQQHLVDVVNEGIYLYYPVDNDKDIIKIVQDVDAAFKPTFGPVTFVGDSKERVTTNNNIRIAPLYMMLLDKIADDWSSVSSGKLQHFGVLSPQTKTEKFMYPYRNSPVRTIGETEGRIFAGYCGREAIAEMMDRSNSPFTQRNVIWNILNSNVPTNIDHVVDREYVRLGGSRPLQLIRHIMGVAGVEIVYEPEDKKSV